MPLTVGGLYRFNRLDRVSLYDKPFKAILYSQVKVEGYLQLDDIFTVLDHVNLCVEDNPRRVGMIAYRVIVASPTKHAGNCGWIRSLPEEEHLWCREEEISLE